MATFNITGDATQSNSFVMVVRNDTGKMATHGEWEVEGDVELRMMETLAAVMARIGCAEVDVVVRYHNA